MAQDKSVWTIDLETTTKSPVGNKASAFWPDNEIVLYGVKRLERDRVHQYRTLDACRSEEFDGSCYIGQNIAFDLYYIYKNAPALHKEHFPTCTIWDTQLAEYLLTGQQSSMVSLDELVDKYGGTKKDNRISRMWDAGIQTEDIPEDMLRDYHQQDILNTEHVFLKQMEQARSTNMLPFIYSQMNALQCTIEMTYNGIQIDTEELHRQAFYLQHEIDQSEIDIQSIANKLGIPDELWIDATSRKTLSALFFGAKYTVKERVPDGVYKNGNAKFKTTEREAIWAGLGVDPSSLGTEADRHGIYSLDEPILGGIKTGRNAQASELADAVLRNREHSKQLSTYLQGIERNIFPDGRIHHSLLHTVTKTGRLSSREPNLQNQTDGPIKKVFITRSAKGVLIEFDYAQLEIVVLAHMSGDKQLIADLMAGKDIHTELYKDMYGGTTPTTKQRKAFKPLSFALVYGAGPGTMAAQSGLSRSECKRFIDTFYRRYPQVKIWHESLISNAKRGRICGSSKTKEGLPQGTYEQVQETGRRLIYKEYDNDYRRGETSFSPTELKNYPVQSFATGDIVPLVLGKLYRKIKSHPKLAEVLLPINTVHDSVLFDLTDEAYLVESIELIKSVMEQVPTYLNETFGISFCLRKLDVGCAVGKNWFEMEKYSI